MDISSGKLMYKVTLWSFPDYYFYRIQCVIQYLSYYLPYQYLLSYHSTFRWEIELIALFKYILYILANIRLEKSARKKSERKQQVQIGG